MLRDVGRGQPRPGRRGHGFVERGLGHLGAIVPAQEAAVKGTDGSDHGSSHIRIRWSPTRACRRAKSASMSPEVLLIACMEAVLRRVSGHEQRADYPALWLRVDSF